MVVTKEKIREFSHAEDGVTNKISRKKVLLYFLMLLREHSKIMCPGGGSRGGIRLKYITGCFDFFYFRRGCHFRGDIIVGATFRGGIQNLILEKWDPSLRGHIIVEHSVTSIKMTN